LNQDILSRLKELLDQLSLRSKILMSAATAIAIVSLIMIFVWANRPEFALLYSKIEAAEAAQIVEDLRSSNTPYQLMDGGTTIMVPKAMIYELRLKYAGQNLITSGNMGYELFDQNNLGLTDFMQKVNLKRALEGELANTINQIDAVSQSRVHLVTPEPVLFAEEDNKATASVILKLKANAMLDRQQVTGVQRLVSASVQGLSPENVVIVDTFGRMLSQNQTAEDDVGLSSSQYELQNNVEKYLAQKAQSMLDKVLGSNNSIVRVSANLNFERLSRTREIVDPDNTVVLSEERNEERSSKTDTTLFQRENVVTNYEMNRTVEQYESSLGDVKRLSVAVFVNGITAADADGNPTRQLRSEEEIASITEIVRTAIGYNEERGDKVVVQQLAFDESMLDRERELMASLESRETFGKYVKIGLIALGSIILLVVLRSAFKKIGFDEYMVKQRNLLLGHQPEAIESATQEVGGVEERRKKDEQARKDKIIREVVDFTESDPDRATRILRYWMVDEDQA
jgi:flagellar M-ring protein FliF